MSAPYEIPNSCCAPVQMTEQSVLYYDDKESVILKSFKDFVVKTSFISCLGVKLFVLKC